MLAELAQRDVAAVDDAFQVDVDDACMVGQRDLVEFADGADAGIVDPDVDASEARHGRGAQGFHGGRIGDVGGDDQRLPARRLHLRRDLVEDGGAARGQHHVGAHRPKFQGDAAPEAARSAGHDIGLAGHRRRLIGVERGGATAEQKKG